ncbi:hypothetical protein HDU98_000253 [Podochytrium sp. JEL0797]|nr:hypothetical protein HDU98_000253 [Podochytrium sp. JEL0797]
MPSADPTLTEPLTATPLDTIDDTHTTHALNRKYSTAGGRRQHPPLELKLRFPSFLKPPQAKPSTPFKEPTSPQLHLLTETDMPAWYQHTPFILTGYRRIGHSYAACIESLKYVHNETGNFYSHAIGAVFFVILQLCTRTFILEPNNASPTDYLIFAMFHFSAVFCLSMSATFHLFCCHSQRVQRNCMKCDYVGIVVLILGSVLATLYYALLCYPAMQTAYMGMMIAAGVLTIGVNASEYFVGPKYRPLRTMLFISIPSLGIIPIFHSILVLEDDWSTLFHMISHPYTFLMLSSYLFGSMLFLFHFPERLYPGYFDYWFQSHQLFHVCVLAGAVFHHVGLVDVFLWRVGEGEGRGCLVGGVGLE